MKSAADLEPSAPAPVRPAPALRLRGSLPAAAAPKGVSVSFVFRRFFRPPRFASLLRPALPPGRDVAGRRRAARFRVSRSRFVPSRHSRRRASGRSGAAGREERLEVLGRRRRRPRGAWGRARTAAEPDGTVGVEEHADRRPAPSVAAGCDREFGSSPSGDGRGGPGSRGGAPGGQLAARQTWRRPRRSAARRPQAAAASPCHGAAAAPATAPAPGIRAAAPAAAAAAAAVGATAAAVAAGHCCCCCGGCCATAVAEATARGPGVHLRREQRRRRVVGRGRGGGLCAARRRRLPVLRLLLLLRCGAGVARMRGARCVVSRHCTRRRQRAGGRLLCCGCWAAACTAQAASTSRGRAAGRRRGRGAAAVAARRRRQRSAALCRGAWARCGAIAAQPGLPGPPPDTWCCGSD